MVRLSWMSGDFKSFILITIKIVLSVCIGFFWGFWSVWWIFIHAYSPSYFSIKSIPLDIIFLPASISVLLSYVLPIQAIILVFPFLIAVALVYILLLLLEKAYNRSRVY